MPLCSRERLLLYRKIDRLSIAFGVKINVRMKGYMKKGGGGNC